MYPNSFHTFPSTLNLCRNVDWQWGPEHDEVIVRLKALLQSAPTLAYFDPADDAWMRVPEGSGPASSSGVAQLRLRRGR